MMNRVAVISDVEEQICPIHGRFSNEALVIGGMTIFAGCPECRQGVERRNAEILVQEEAEKNAAKIERNRRSCGVPSRYRECTVDSFNAIEPWQVELRETMRAYLAHFENALRFGINLVLTGIGRSGKTHIGCALVNELVSAGRNARYVSANDLLLEIREASRIGGGVLEITRPLMAAELLVIDDVGSQGGSANDIAHLFRIINTRHSECRPTVLISHLDLGGLAQHLNDRVIMRLLEQSEHFQFHAPYRMEN